MSDPFDQLIVRSKKQLEIGAELLRALEEMVSMCESLPSTIYFEMLDADVLRRAEAIIAEIRHPK